MTKADFIDAVASRSGLSKKDAGAALDAVLESVKDALKNGLLIEARNHDSEPLQGGPRVRRGLV